MMNTSAAVIIICLLHYSAKHLPRDLAVHY